jgi:pimeloyl-ACP methyl ester carboxylesterase
MKAVYKIVILFLLFFPQGNFAQQNSFEDIIIVRDEIKLKGRFYQAGSSGLSVTVILLPGFPGGGTDVFGIGKKLSESGINAVTFNYSGTHQSEGLYNFTNSLSDIKAAYDFIHKPDNIIKYGIDTSKIILGGYSYGGGMALSYAAIHPEIDYIFSVAGTDHGEFMREYNRNTVFAENMDAWFEKLKAPDGPVRFDVFAVPGDIARKEISVVEPMLDLRKAAPMLASREILLIGGWDDAGPTIDHHILPLYRALQKENAAGVKITALQTDHSFKNVRAELGAIIVDWVNGVLVR